MAFSAANLARIGGANGFGLYRYDSLDSVATVINDNYIDNDANDVNLVVGDMVWIYDWDIAVRTGQIADVGLAVVLEVETSGQVRLSNDLLVTTVTYT